MSLSNEGIWFRFDVFPGLLEAEASIRLNKQLALLRCGCVLCIHRLCYEFKANLQGCTRHFTVVCSPLKVNVSWGARSDFRRVYWPYYSWWQLLNLPLAHISDYSFVTEGFLNDSSIPKHCDSHDDANCKCSAIRSEGCLITQPWSVYLL